jgi:hypothetical protein
VAGVPVANGGCDGAWGCHRVALLYPYSAGRGQCTALASQLGVSKDWDGFWWLVSGAAYRGYLFNAPTSTILGRIAAWANTLTTQYTPVGLALALLGLSHWDRHHSALRNFSLLWIIPVSLYSINYYHGIVRSIFCPSFG